MLWLEGAGSAQLCAALHSFQVLVLAQPFPLPHELPFLLPLPEGLCSLRLKKIWLWNEKVNPSCASLELWDLGQLPCLENGEKSISFIRPAG